MTEVPTPMINSPTVKVACTPNENTSGVAGIFTAAPSVLGYSIGEYTDIDWKYWFHSVMEMMADGCHMNPSRLPIPQLLPITPSWAPYNIPESIYRFFASLNVFPIIICCVIYI